MRRIPWLLVLVAGALTVIAKAASDALSVPSLTVITMPLKLNIT